MVIGRSDDDTSEELDEYAVLLDDTSEELDKYAVLLDDAATEELFSSWISYAKRAQFEM